MRLLVSKRINSYELLKYAMLEIGYSSLPTILKTEYGKPYFEGNDQLHFNLSDSDGISVCAIAEEPVGVDVENITRQMPKHVNRYLSESEKEYVLSQGDEAFFLIWTRKEAYCKWIGKGLVSPVSSIEVPIPPNDTMQSFTIKTYRVEDWIISVCSTQITLNDIEWIG